MRDLRFSMNISRTPNIDRSRPAAQSQEEARTEPDTQDSSTPSTSSPNRAAHERQKLQQLQRMLGETSGSNSERPLISNSQESQASERNEERATSPTRQSKAISLLKRSRSKKSGMAKVLSKFFPACCIEVSPREELQDKLVELKDHFEKLKAENWSPYDHEFYGDKAFFPIAVKAENARNPELNLHNFDKFQSFTDALKNRTLQNGRALFPLSSKEDHVVAADIRTIGDTISILVLEPFSLKKNPDFKKRYVFKETPVMSEKLPENAKLTVLYFDAQKSSNDCGIFALSTASKLAKESEFVDRTHKENLSDSGELGPFKYPKVRLRNAHQRVPTSFHKHSQSKSSLNKSADKDSLTKTTVNKKGDTLLSRYDKHVVDRYKAISTKSSSEPSNLHGIERISENRVHIQRSHQPDGNKVTLKPVRFSASIEEKRLTYLDRAIAYLNDAPEQEISALLRDFNKTMKMNKKNNKELASKSIEREVGPQRSVSELRANILPDELDEFTYGEMN